jgi:LEA14-like dessication related protein
LIFSFTNQLRMFTSRTLLFPLLFVILSFSLTSCNIKPVLVTGVQDVKILKLDATGIQFQAGLKIKNENGIGFNISGSELEFKMNGVYLGKVELGKRIKVRRKSESVHPVVLKATFQDLFSSLPKLMKMAQDKSGNVEINGYVKVGTLFVHKKFPVNINQKQVPVEKQ